jgi:DNA-binding transcriptional regulator LsrR (DeoR family)
MVFRKPLETLADILQVGCNILHESHQVHSGYHIGEEELDDAVEQRIAGMICIFFFLM